MRESDLERYRTRLLQLEADLLAEGDIPIEPIRTDPAQVGADEDEQPLAEMNQVIASKRNQARAQTLQRVRRALKLINDDPEMFGLCSECEEPIGRRLEAMPYAEKCVECQAGADDPRRGGSRKHLLDFK